MTYSVTVAGVKRDLTICKLTDTLSIAAFIILGDVELTCACAKALLEKAPEFDYMVVPEGKSIPLIHEMARQSGRNEYFLARKKKEAYMQGVFEVTYQSTTTEGEQQLFMDVADAAKMKGKRILLLDDIISTGGSLAALEALVKRAGGNVVGRMAIFAAGDAAKRDDILFLEPLPFFHPDGSVMA